MKSEEQDKNKFQDDEEYEEELDEQPETYLDDVNDEPITWEGHEYLHIDKSPLWFILFVIVVLGLIAIDFFILKSVTFSILVVVMAIATVIYTRRPPKQITYSLSPKQGLYIAERLYRFADFKSFGYVKDGDHNTIMLIPTKRFATGVTVYFPDEAGEDIIDIFGQHLPMEEIKPDIIDVVIRKLRL